MAVRREKNPARHIENRTESGETRKSMGTQETLLLPHERENMKNRNPRSNRESKDQFAVPKYALA
jgi:hypothetical protein